MIIFLVFMVVAMCVGIIIGFLCDPPKLVGYQKRDGVEYITYQLLWVKYYAYREDPLTVWIDFNSGAKLMHHWSHLDEIVEHHLMQDEITYGLGKSVGDICHKRNCTGIMSNKTVVLPTLEHNIIACNVCERRN